MEHLHGVDLFVLIAYLVGTVALGVWVGRHGQTTDEFMAAGRRIPGWAVGLSIFGTYVSSISFLALPAKAYGQNWNAFVFSLSIPLTTWIAVRYFVPFYRQAGGVSAYEHLEARFGPWARTYAVACYILTQLSRMGTILYLLALAIAPLTGWSIPFLIFLTGCIVIAYTLIGGIEAVIWTDVVQSVVFIVGALACVVVLTMGIPGGAPTAWRLAVENDKLSLGSFGPGVTESTFWVVLFYGIFTNLNNFGIDQSFVQRYQTAKSDREAKRSVWLGAMLYLPISAVFFLIGTLLFAFYTMRPGELPAEVASKADTVFPHFISTHLPWGLAGLVISAILAAAQSTLSSSINCCATLFLCDIYRRYFRRDATESESMGVLRIMTLLFGVAGMLIGLEMMHIKSILDAWWSLASIFSGGMLGLFLLGFIPRIQGIDAAVGVLAGAIVIMWTSIPWISQRLGVWESPFHLHLTIVLGTLTVIFAALLFRWLRPDRSARSLPLDRS
jgi:solute:Na+ symporter, SSS family